ncbi:hypothetical protein IGI66_002246 [Enterococcus sp. AZ048]
MGKEKGAQEGPAKVAAAKKAEASEYTQTGNDFSSVNMVN